MRVLFIVIFIIQIFKVIGVSQSFYAHAKIVGLQHQFPKIMGQGLEVGCSLTSKNKHFRTSLSYYNYVSRGILTSARVVNNRLDIKTYNHTRSEEGLKLGFGYRFELGKKWKIGSDLSFIKANIEIISQDKYFPIISEAIIQNIPFPAYYAYRDYLGQVDLSLVYILKNNHELFINTFYAQSPWNSTLSKNWGCGLGINVNVFNIK